MPSHLTIAITVAAALASAPALAASGAVHDDTTYPEAPAIWAGAGVLAPADQPGMYDDVAYPGAHMTIARQAPLPAPDAVLATLDDTAYPTADWAPARARPSGRAVPASEPVACCCARQ